MEMVRNNNSNNNSWKESRVNKKAQSVRKQVYNKRWDNVCL